MPMPPYFASQVSHERRNGHPISCWWIPLTVDERLVCQRYIDGIRVAHLRRSKRNLLWEFDWLIPPAVLQHELLDAAFQGSPGRCREFAAV